MTLGDTAGTDDGLCGGGVGSPEGATGLAAAGAGGGRRGGGVGSPDGATGLGGGAYAGCRITGAASPAGGMMTAGMPMMVAARPGLAEGAGRAGAALGCGLSVPGVMPLMSGGRGRPAGSRTMAVAQ